MACDDEELKKIKAEQKKAKEGEGEHMVYGQDSDASSISSSDESDLEEHAETGRKKKGALERGVSAVEDPKGTVKKVFEKKGRRKREKREVKEDTPGEDDMVSPSGEKGRGNGNPADAPGRAEDGDEKNSAVGVAR